MKRHIVLMLASAAMFSTTMVGCANTNMASRAAINTNEISASRIEDALAKKDYARALVQAEVLVVATPDDAASRALLGRAYFANGRFASARTAFSDAMSLGNVEPRIIISLALCQIGLGDVSAARELLLNNREHLPAADYGLAMAMANEPQEGVRALLEAVRMPEATAQTRQNLAYALALGGAWGQARLVAGQDLTAKAADRRIAQWLQLGVVNNPQQRVVALVGIAPRSDDGGMPTHLALDVAAPAKMASALESGSNVEPATQIAARPIAVTPEKIAAPVDAQHVVHALPTKQMIAAPAIDFSKAPLIEEASRAALRSVSSPARSAAIQVAPSKPPHAPRSEKTASFDVPRDKQYVSDWVVQLGAFDSMTIAKDKWRTMQRSWTSLGAFDETYNLFVLNGRTFHRLAVRGFSDHAQANALCKSLMSKGQDCFVRRDAGDDVRMASGRLNTGSLRPADQQIAVR